ncbi:hypothetical protein R1flu_006518 [Riccia fluitans]|uniref:Uncharacterized protein n=1 Tax=Riccia fluitans TaxID=41844 RepID=A0ABD1YXA2_9MARC
MSSGLSSATSSCTLSSSLPGSPASSSAVISSELVIDNGSSLPGMGSPTIGTSEANGDFHMLLLEMVVAGQCASVQAAAGEVVAEKSMIATEPSVVEPSILDPHERHKLLELMLVESISPNLTQVAVHLSNWTMVWPANVPKSPTNAMLEVMKFGQLAVWNSRIVSKEL